MIPKKIHYCWFGRNPLPESALKCIASWERYLPDYEIIEWNEDNFDVDSIPYTSQAYATKRYAFVSDFARFKILYENGGLYFDTDVEVIRPMNDIIDRGPFMGFEINPNSDAPFGAVNPGLGIAANKCMPLYNEIIDYYKGLNYIDSEGRENQTTVVTYITDILRQKGLAGIDGIQDVAGITIYPREYFNPMDSLTGKLKITEQTRSIHWYTMSWLNRSEFRTKFSRMLHRLFGVGIFIRIRKMLGH